MFIHFFRTFLWRATSKEYAGNIFETTDLNELKNHKINKFSVNFNVFKYIFLELSLHIKNVLIN